MTEMEVKGEKKDGYKKTKLGLIPKDWDVKKLGKLFEFKNGINAGKDAYGKGVKFVNVMDVFGNTFISHDNIIGSVSISEKQLEKNLLHQGDVLFNRTSEIRDEIGMTALYNDNEKAVFGGFVIRGRPKSNNLLPEFSAYGFQSESVRRQIIAKGQGAVRVNIGQGDLEQVYYPIPPKKEQANIVDVISSWDEAISKTEKLIKAKKRYKKGLMQRLLSGKFRFPEFEGKEWAEVKLGDLTKGDRIKGKSVELNTENRGVPYIGSTSFTGNFSDYTEDPKAVIAEKNDLLLLWDGEYAGKVATNLEGATSSTVAVIRLNERVNNLFLKLLMEHENQKIRAITEGSGIPHIPTDFIKTYKIKLPSKDEQDRIVNLMRGIETEINLLKQQAKLLRKQKKGLMQQLLTGKVRVNNLN